MRGQIAKGAAWMVLFRLFDRSLGIVSTAVLARLLLPNDFGLVAMAISVIAIIELATAFGFEMALIQMREPQRAHFDSAWSLNLLLALAGAAVTVLAAWPAAAFYGDPRLIPVMLAIAAGWLVAGFENIGIVNFRREMNFGAEFRFMSSKRVIGFVVTLVAALLLQSYWALVIGTTTTRLAGVVLSYVMHPFRPHFTLARARELFSFSGWIFVNNLLGVAFARAPHFFVGRVFGAQSLGVYSVASEIAQLAQTELVAPINRAMFPGYSRLKSDMPLFRRTCVEATAVILLIALPVSVGIAVLAGPFVRLLLGSQWGDAVPVIPVLAVAATVAAITSNNMSIYLALGRPHLTSMAMAARLVAMVIGLAWFGQSMGVIGVAWAELFAAGASLAVSLPTLFITIGIRPRDYFGIFWRPALASALMGWAIQVSVRPGFSAAQTASAAVELASGIALGALLYPLAIALLWRLGGAPDAMEVQLYQRLVGAIKARLSMPRGA